MASDMRSDERKESADEIHRWVERERSRCAEIAESLAAKWEASAAKVRAKGTARMLWIGPSYVVPSAERDAVTILAAASGVRTIARLIRSGAIRADSSLSNTTEPK